MRILQVGTNKRSGKRPRLLGVYGLLLVAVAVLAVAGMGGGAAFAADAQHGIALTKGCVSPTQIGQPYVCTYSVRNRHRRGAGHAHDHEPRRRGSRCERERQLGQLPQLGAAVGRGVLPARLRDAADVHRPGDDRLGHVRGIRGWGRRCAPCRTARASTSAASPSTRCRRPTSTSPATCCPTRSTSPGTTRAIDQGEHGRHELHPGSADQRCCVAVADHSASVDDRDDDPQRRSRGCDRGRGGLDRARLRDGHRRRRQPGARPAP